MAGQAKIPDSEMDHAGIPGTLLQVSRITLGAWATGGWMWGQPMKRSPSQQSKPRSNMGSL